MDSQKGKIKKKKEYTNYPAQTGDFIISDP
jgi:hypothetical protein